jgi:hypothetical protein
MTMNNLLEKPEVSMREKAVDAYLNLSSRTADLALYDMLATYPDHMDENAKMNAYSWHSNALDILHDIARFLELEARPVPNRNSYLMSFSKLGGLLKDRSKTLDLDAIEEEINNMSYKIFETLGNIYAV